MSSFVNWVALFFGGLVASLVAIFIWEKYRQPKLTVELAKAGPAIQTLQDGTRRAFYKLLVRNIGKSPAYYCKVFMRFFDEQGNRPVITDVFLANGTGDQNQSYTYLFQFRQVPVAV